MVRLNKCYSCSVQHTIQLSLVFEKTRTVDSKYKETESIGVVNEACVLRAHYTDSHGYLFEEADSDLCRPSFINYHPNERGKGGFCPLLGRT